MLARAAPPVAATVLAYAWGVGRRRVSSVTHVMQAGEAEFQRYPIESFRVQGDTIDQLRAHDITELFPVQAKTFDYVFDGRDVITRARTGTGKTLGFGLPVLERLRAGERTRFPRFLVLCPTRELAKQVTLEFKKFGHNLRITTIYGGVSFAPQEMALRHGVDVVVGTPGRIIDHMERGGLVLKDVRQCVLDEADDMLKMGFASDVERILAETPHDGRQTLLFSATIPTWVQQVSQRFLRSPVMVDFVGEDTTRTTTTVSHVAICVPDSAKADVLGDLIAVHAREKILVFTRTKIAADNLVEHPAVRAEAGVLHGDISQAMREMTLQGFRTDKFRVLVATDVASRGLDIPNVDLVIHFDFPQIADEYVHRSGRTGRVGKGGMAILLYNENDAGSLPDLEKDVKITFKRMPPPSSGDVLRASIEIVHKLIDQVEPAVLSYFRKEAKKMIEHENKVDLVAAALACVSGHTKMVEPRSLLSAREDYTAVLFRGMTRRDAMETLKRATGPGDRLGLVREYQGGVIADVPTRVVDQLLDAVPQEGLVEVAEELPPLLPERIRHSRLDPRRRERFGPPLRDQRGRRAVEGEEPVNFRRGRFLDNKRRVPLGERVLALLAQREEQDQ